MGQPPRTPEVNMTVTGLQQEPGNEPLLDLATDMLTARYGCTPDVAFALLTGAARGHAVDIDDLATCVVVTGHRLRSRPGHAEA
jgi:hypothetical protein